MPLTWNQLRTLAPGTRLRFTMCHDIYPYCVVPEGTTATLLGNEYDNTAVQGDFLAIVLPDDMEIRKALEDWEGQIQLNPDSFGIDWTERDEESPVSLLD